MDPMVTSALISTGGNLLGGLMGGKQKAPSYYPYMKALVGPERAKKYTMGENLAYHEKNMFKAKMDSAKEFGLSKLAMLGVPFSSTPPMQVGGGSSGSMDSTVAGLGQDLGRVAEAYMTQGERAQARAMTALDLEGKQLDNDYKRALISSTMAPRMQAGNPPAVGSGTSLNQALDGIVPNRIGYGDGVVPMHTLAMDENGNLIRTWNQDLGDNEVMQALHAFRYSVPDYIDGNFIKPAGRSLANFLRSSGSFFKRNVRIGYNSDWKRALINDGSMPRTNVRYYW